MITNKTASACALFIGITAVSIAPAVHAQSRAVTTTNFELAVDSADSDTSGSTSNGTLGGALIANVPLGNLFGLSLSGGYATTTVRTRDVLIDLDTSGNEVRPSCSFENLSGEIGLFARRPTLGKIGLSYGVGEVSADCSVSSVFIPSGDDTLDTDGYRAEIEGYLGNFTLGASYASLNLDDGPKLETTTVTASWYPIDSVRVSLFGNDMYDDNSYGLLLEHQPEFLGDGFGVKIGYTRSDGEPNMRIVQLGLSYYFGKRVPLKIRDRQYR